MEKRPFILDVDTGTDDAMAIIAAVKAAELDLRAITVTHGNQPLPNTLENTLRVVQFLGADVPVFAGCPDPMVRTLTAGREMNVRRQPYEQVIDGQVVNMHEDYLPLPPAKIAPQSEHAVAFLLRTLRAASTPITVVAVGPLTNIAMALRLDPGIARNIRELIVMGGGIRAVNSTSDSEFNFFADPEAAQIVLKAGARVTILPLDATTSALFDRRDAQCLRDIGTPEAEFFGRLIADFIDRMALLGISNTSDPGDHSAAIHDARCVLYMLDPRIVTDLRREACDVDFSGGFADGQLIVDTRSYMPRDDETYVAYGIDKERVMRLLCDLLGR